MGVPSTELPPLLAIMVRCPEMSMIQPWNNTPCSMKTIPVLNNFDHVLNILHMATFLKITISIYFFLFVFDIINFTL